MTIQNASKVIDKIILLTFDKEIDYRYKRISVNGNIYNFGQVYDARYTVSIPLENIKPEEFVGKEAIYIE